ncbi:MAG: T9SS type A sorting domain-containing protein [Bacteroidales bacterium]|nr:T9SS type A sorting domain-containing protein [Bacteroidales bacterium]MCF8457783.1 T9SS type A sorting domain-containing protein [Bacteroidales bacterium]
MKKIFLLLALCTGITAFLNAQLVPNGSFEDWTTQTMFDEPDSFMTTNMQAYFTFGVHNVSKTTDCHGGNYAIRLETMQAGQDVIPGGVFIGMPGEGGIGGGIPYSGVPDSVHVWAKYSISTGDTAMMAVFFKSNSDVIAISFLQFIGDQNSYALERSPVTWFTWGIPDSVSMVAFSSSPDNSTGAGSVLFLDDIALTGTPQQLPNNGFENWANLAYEDPEYWMSSNFISISGGGVSVSKSSDHYHGSFSLKLETTLTAWDDSISFITNGHIGESGPAGGIPISDVPDKFTFYYKSTPIGADSSVAGAWLFYYDPGLDSVITLEEIFVTLPPATDWTYFEVPFTYTGPEIPDTLNIAFSASHIEETGGEISLGSVMYVDKVELVPTISIDEIGSQSAGKLLISPNPASDFVNIWFSGGKSSLATIAVYNAFGARLIESVISNADGCFRLNTSEFAPGIYIINAYSEKDVFVGKFVKGQ